MNHWKRKSVALRIIFTSLLSPIERIFSSVETL